MSNLFSSKPQRKPLKGGTVSSNYGVFDTVSTNTLVIESINVAGLFEDGILLNAIIQDSEIRNTVIGLDGPNTAYFTNLYTYNDVNFYGNLNDASVKWDAVGGIFTINGELVVRDCTRLGNIKICNNDVYAVNSNGDVNILSNNFGTVNIRGPVSLVSTTGNLFSEVRDGSSTFLTRDNFLIYSSRGSLVATAFDSSSINTINGDLALNVDSGISNTNVTTIRNSSGNTILTSASPHNLKSGDVINLSNPNPTLNKSFTVGNILTSSSFTLLPNTSLTDVSTSGSFSKVPSNDIILNSRNYVKIPSDTKLTFGATCNSVSGNATRLVISSCGDTLFTTTSAVQIPQNTKFALGTSGNTYLTFDGNALNIVSNVTNFDSSTTLFKDPILTLANYNLASNDFKDRGIEFKYFDPQTNSTKLGWFGYKNSTGRFTFITNATNNNEVITGDTGSLELNNLVLDNILLVQNGTIDTNCGQILNVKTITSCANDLTITAPTLSVNSSNKISLNATNSVTVPSGTKVQLGTSFLLNEGAGGTLTVYSPSNVLFTTGSLNIPTASRLTFDGTKGASSILSNSSGELLIASNNNIILSTTSASIIIPQSTPIAFGNTTSTISGSTAGINLVSSFSGASVNVSATSAVNVSSANINLLATSKVTVPTEVPLFLGTNFAKTTSDGNLFLSGSGANLTTNFSNINLSASSNVNVPQNVPLNFGTTGSIVATFGQLLISNSSGGLTVASQTMSLSSGTLSITNNQSNVVSTTANISASSLVVSGSTTKINSSNTFFADPIITIADPPIPLAAPDNKDRGIEWKYFDSSSKLAWIGSKSNNTNRFTFYSNAINTNEVISGTMGDLEISTMYLNKDLVFSSSGTLNMACGTISNVNLIDGCTGVLRLRGTTKVDLLSNTVNVSSSNINVPFNSPINFGASSNSILTDSSGNMIISSSSEIVLNSNVRINGESTTIYSTVTNIADPILSLGGVTGPIVDDLKDRGIEVKWATGGSSKTGFFGYKNSLQKFVFIKDGINNNEVFSGIFGDVQFGNGTFTNLDLQNGVINSLKEISGGQISVITTAGNLSLTPTTGSSVLLPFNVPIAFGSTANSIVSSSAGALQLSSKSDLTLASNSGGINLSTNSQINVPQNVRMYFGTSGTAISSNSSGAMQITGAAGVNFSTSSVNIPTNTLLNFGSTSNSIYSNGDQLLLNGYKGISMTAPTLTITGDLDVIGSLSVGASDLDTNKFILPLGTNQVVNVLSASNVVNSAGNVQVSVDKVHNFTPGDLVTIKNVNSSPSIDGDYEVRSILGPTTFVVSSGSGVLTTAGTKGLVKSNLTTFQGKDVGIQVNYWSTTNVPSITAGSLAYKTGFFGWKNEAEQWQFYKNATISNDVVTGSLGDVSVNKIFTNRISGFTLDGPVSAGNNLVSGNNFAISGGNIQSTPIGNSIASTGRFTTLTNTVQAVFQNVTLQSSLSYSFERYTLDSATLPTRNPSTNVILSMFSVNGPNWTSSSGTMPSFSVPDGTFKILMCSSIGTGSSHEIFFGEGKLITPNPMNTSAKPTKLIFKRVSQSAQLVYDAVQSAWILIGSGAYVA